jgi:hypothetical protein
MLKAHKNFLIAFAPFHRTIQNAADVETEAAGR